MRKWGDRIPGCGPENYFYTRLDNYEKELRKIAGDCSCEEREEKIKRYTADYQCFVRLKHILLRRFAEQLPEEDPVVQVLPDKMLAWAVMADPSVFQQEMKEAGGLLARADTLAYRMKRGVEFSDSLELVYRGKVLKVLDGIWACYEQNGDKREYFDRVTGLRLRLLNDMQVEKLPEIRCCLLIVVFCKNYLSEKRKPGRSSDKWLWKQTGLSGKIFMKPEN